MAAHSSILPGETHGQRSLAGYSQWGRKELDTTERLHFLSLIICPERAMPDSGVLRLVLLVSCSEYLFQKRQA